MNENNVQDAQVVEKPVLHKDTVALESFKSGITNSKENFKKQLADVNEAIVSREEEIKVLTVKKHKLAGAIEASDLYLKPTK